MRLLTVILLVTIPALTQAQDTRSKAKKTSQSTSTPKVSAPKTDLRAAFKKEFAFLESEESVLNKRLAQLKRDVKREQAQQKGALAYLQRQIVQKSTEAESLAEAVVTLDREVESLGESEDALVTLAQQMSRSLESDGRKWTPNMEPKADESAVARLDRESKTLKEGVNFAIQGLTAGGQVKRKAGKFFLASGKQVDGTLLHVGRIAVYGVAGQKAGALTPAGNGEFKLDPVQGAESARALLEGQQIDKVELFLFENTAKNFEAPKEKTVLQIIESGGIIAWVIVGLGCFALLLIMVRALLLALAGTNTESLWTEVKDAVAAGKHVDVGAHCQQKRGAGARLLSALAPTLNREREDIERVFAERMVVEEAALDRFGTLILVIAAVAPLLGLLGTVTGMISTFDVITEFGTGNPKLLSGGISEALVTTELGLCVAIPALLFGNILNGWASRMKDNLEFGSLRMINTAHLGADTSEEREEETLAPASLQLSETR